MSQLAAAVKTALQIPALSSRSTRACDAALVDVLAVGSIIWDEDGHVVRRAVSSQAGAVVAAIRVLAGGVLPTDLIVTYLTLVFIWKETYLLHFNIGESGLE